MTCYSHLSRAPPCHASFLLYYIEKLLHMSSLCSSFFAPPWMEKGDYLGKGRYS